MEKGLDYFVVLESGTESPAMTSFGEDVHRGGYFFLFQRAGKNKGLFWKSGPGILAGDSDGGVGIGFNQCLCVLLVSSSGWLRLFF